MSAFSRPGGQVSPDAYRRLVSALAKRAARTGARDPEGAAQEAVKRSLVHPVSRAAVEYYFREKSVADHADPEWSLLQLLGWLHGTLRFVVLEERARSQREVPAAEIADPVDPARTPVQHLIDAQMHEIVQDALSTLSTDHRSALVLRLQGTKYIDIAKQLGVNENTVATWVRRGSRALVEQIRRRLTSTAGSGRTVRNMAGASHR